MRINHNIASLGTQSALFRVNRDLGKSMEKLSTGQRINSAADDAAGLGVSENLRTQVRGLGQALRNQQDVIAMLNIADGALQEQASILQRMRELVIQAKNDTYTSTERAYMYDEFAKSMDQLDQIAATTNFNGMQLFATPNISGLDVDGGGIERHIYLANYSNGFSNAGLETAHATARNDTIYTDPSKAIFGPNDRSSAHHFNMMVGANWSAEDAAADRAANYNSVADRGAANMMTIQFGQMDVNALLSPYPSGRVIAGSNIDMGDARELWDSFAWNGNPVAWTFPAQYDSEDTYMDFYGPGQVNGTRDTGYQGKMNLLLTVMDGKTDEINTNLDNQAWFGNRNVTGIDRINKMRAAIGAWTNRIEHSINNTQNQIAGQQSAESVIRDTDFATEATALTRSQILTQSATAMLAQSNTMPRSVLQLIG